MTQTINDREFTDYEHAAVTVDPLLVQMEMERVSGDLAYFNAQFADRANDAALAKVDYERAVARADGETRASPPPDGKKWTEKSIESAVLLNEIVHTAKMKQIGAEHQMALTKGLAEAVKAKREMLVSIGAQMRAEMAGDPILREQVRESNAHRRDA